MSIYNLIRSAFDGYKEGTEDRRTKQAFDELDNTPYLFGSDYLKELYGKATTKEEHMSILDHMYRHDCYDIPSYASLEKTIVEKWRGNK